MCEALSLNLPLTVHGAVLTFLFILHGQVTDDVARKPTYFLDWHGDGSILHIFVLLLSLEVASELLTKSK